MPIINVVIDDPDDITSVIENIGPRGPQGPPGPPGVAGSGNRLSQLIGDGFATVFEIAHGFGTREVTVQVIEELDGALVNPEVSIPDTVYVRIVFAQPPAWQQYRVIVTT